MLCRAGIDRTAAASRVVLRHVRRDRQFPHLVHEIGRVVRLIGATVRRRSGAARPCAASMAVAASPSAKPSANRGLRIENQGMSSPDPVGGIAG
jgi:hypothetical protein